MGPLCRLKLLSVKIIASMVPLWPKTKCWQEWRMAVHFTAAIPQYSAWHSGTAQRSSFDGKKIG